MTDEQYVDAMLKIAYAAGCEVARQEKEAAGALPRPNIPTGANQTQARSRGENPRGKAYMQQQQDFPGSPVPGPPKALSHGAPRMIAGGRTPGVRLRNRQQQQQPGRSVAGQ